MQPKRIVILGNAGSGKSSLARQLGEKLALPVVHLDRLFWGPGWTKPVASEFRVRVSAAIKDSRWICEGNYHRRTFDLRLPTADLIIWLDAPRLICMKRVALRSLRNEPRPDLPDGCTEKIDAEFVSFLRYVWRFDRYERPAIEAERRAKGLNVPVVHLRGKAQINEFVSAIISSSPTVD
ncbi:AAA family ATPase [Affinibrenneria salicis]|uniref:AAA family ATPase n=1 Tax=Affinibrenneria salicis TaxID=2590031 RepID=A0A5J5G048_9GAMM|nr:AAA family ATPase [Affinibrenneria salicis]KAA8998941.1 AAA family ATPase [Affinibrenneria salicis]